MKRYPKIRRPGSETQGLLRADDDELIVTEKCDGNNFRLMLTDDAEFRFGSRNVVLGTGRDTDGNGMFDDVIEWAYETIDMTDLMRVENRFGRQLTLFGENAVKHTIEDYDWERMPRFQLFDVWAQPHDGESTNEAGDWLEWSAVETVADELGIETVPVIDRTTVGEFDTDGFEIPASVYRPEDRVAEGVVLRNVDTGVKAKLISEEFAEKHGSAKSASADELTEEGQFAQQYATKQRVEKRARRLIEEPDYEYDSLEMEMMPDLGPAVYDDIWAEHYDEIAYEDWDIDMGNVRSEVSSATAGHLRELIREDEIPVPSADC